MGCQNRYQPHHDPCTNCGKPEAGIMSATSWNHNYYCCSDRCGKRLRKRIENGMYAPSIFGVRNREEDTENLRFRVKQLEAQLKNNGIKPVRTVYNNSIIDELVVYPGHYTEETFDALRYAFLSVGVGPLTYDD